MNVLFVVPYVPSLVRARSYNLIRHLAARGHRLTVATVWSSDREWAEVEALKSDCEVHAVRLPVWRSLANCVRALPGSEPLQSVYSWSEGLTSRIAALQPQADVVHVEHLRGARYALYANSLQSTCSAPVVWDSVDCISYLFEQSATARRDRIGRVINRVELGRTRRHEGWLCRQFDRVCITSEADRRAIVALAAEAGPGGQRSGDDYAVTIIPNGVDTAYFTPTGEPRQPQTLVFSGKMSYHANVTAAVQLITEIMPRVWAALPDARLMIVGKDPAAPIQACAARHSGRVTVTGTVPDVRPFLRQATAAVIPLVYGAGSQFKVLEAMACATPVVATPRAVAALQAQAGRDVLVAAEPDAFARRVVELLANTSAQQALGEAGRRYVEAHHRWADIAARLEAVYQNAIANRERSTRGARLTA